LSYDSRVAKLLVVDDEAAFLQVLVDHLKRLGHEVAACSDPREAAALAESSGPELAILDYAMPALKGPELLSRLRGRNPKLAAIFLSAVPPLRYSSEVPPDPLVRFLSKPVLLDVLDEAIKSLLDPEGWSARS